MLAEVERSTAALHVVSQVPNWGTHSWLPSLVPRWLLKLSSFMALEEEKRVKEHAATILK